jgi:hypothetical protein
MQLAMNAETNVVRKESRQKGDGLESLLAGL